MLLLKHNWAVDMMIILCMVTVSGSTYCSITHCIIYLFSYSCWLLASYMPFFFWDMQVCGTWKASCLLWFWYHSMAYWQTMGGSATSWMGQGIFSLYIFYTFCSSWTGPVPDQVDVLGFQTWDSEWQTNW